MRRLGKVVAACEQIFMRCFNEGVQIIAVLRMSNNMEREQL